MKDAASVRRQRIRRNRALCYKWMRWTIANANQKPLGIALLRSARCDPTHSEPALVLVRVSVGISIIRDRPTCPNEYKRIGLSAGVTRCAGWVLIDHGKCAGERLC